MATIKNTSKALEAKSNVKRGANISKGMADALARQTVLARESEEASTKLLDAAIAFAVAVKTGVATVAFGKAKKGEADLPDDTARFVAAYSEGLKMPLSAESQKMRCSQYRAFAHPLTIERHDEIRASLEKAMAGKTKKQCGDRDLFSAHRDVCVAFKNAKDGVVPVLAKTVKELVAPRAKVTPTPKAAEVTSPADIVKAKREEFVTAMAAVLELKSLPKGAKAHLEALRNLKW